MQEEIFFTKGAFAHLIPQIFVVLIFEDYPCVASESDKFRQ